MAVVVTGSAGFLGGHLARALAASGQQVVAVDRRPTPPLPGVTPLVADLTAADSRVRTALREADAVWHLAGCPGVRDTAADVAARRRRDNVEATAAVLADVRPHTPLVVTSSSSVYGGSRGRPCREGDRLDPRGGYARSKAEVERRCAERLAAGGLVAVARPFTVLGPGQRPDMAVAQWLEALRLGVPIPLLGGRERTRDLTDVDHVVRGLVVMAERGVCGPVNLGTGVAYSLGTLLDETCRAAGREPVAVVVTPAPAADVAATLADTTRCREALGFVPSTDLRAVLRRQVAATVAAVPA